MGDTKEIGGTGGRSLDKRAAMTDLTPTPTDDATKAVRFMLAKAAIFVGIPLMAAIIAAVAVLFR